VVLEEIDTRTGGWFNSVEILVQILIISLKSSGKKEECGCESVRIGQAEEAVEGLTTVMLSASSK
jgi:hypothetical protein